MWKEYEVLSFEVRVLPPENRVALTGSGPESGSACWSVGCSKSRQDTLLRLVGSFPSTHVPRWPRLDYLFLVRIVCFGLRLKPLPGPSSLALFSSLYLSQVSDVLIYVGLRAFKTWK